MFFGYFLNIKKVTPSADFVIGPAKAEAFLFSHTRLPFPPRPLLPFGRISPAAKPRVRSSAPQGPMCWPAPLSLRSSVAPRPTTRRLSPFGSISLRETARTVTGPTGAGILPSPSRLRRAGSPTAKPRRLLPFGCISPAAKPRGRYFRTFARHDCKSAGFSL